MNTGAGLVCRDMIGSWTQVAIATTAAVDSSSGRQGCAPTVFVKLSSTFYAWINNVITATSKSSYVARWPCTIRLWSNTW